MTEEGLLNQKHQNNVLLGSKPVGVVAGGSTQAEELSEDESSFVAGAVMPSAVLESSSGSEEEVSPLTMPHLHWECTLMGPVADDLMTVMGMIDSGAHIVLIDEMLVQQLGLRCFHMHKPLPISVALNNSPTSESYLYEYVTIAPYSPDSAWTSQMLKAVIMPNLCVPLLLGLPFLTVNCIITDFECHTAIVKMSGYDLLELPVHKHHKEPTNCKQAITETRNCKKLMLMELVSICKQ